MSEALQTLGGRLREGAGVQALLRRQLAEAEEAAAGLQRQAALLEQVPPYLAAILENWKVPFQSSVGQLISEGLSGVFDEALELLVDIGIQGDLPSVDFQMRDSRELVTDVMDARGGGLVNVGAFLLKMLMLLASRPAQARLMVLDEPFVNVNESRFWNLTALIERIRDDAGFQFIFVTQIEALANALGEIADVMIRFDQLDGVTRARTVTGPGEAFEQADVSP